ncbi:Hypothetical_protein [Hexamita inflata]|uniref:Hypothetical_protein n=1 Tax=Hexamita inflata TaxID=28002 RepID=A0AA86PN54_9EUKA|nr:Hypothetical protein HINF_LOCUS27923 [Hexamita inflata]
MRLLAFTYSNQYYQQQINHESSLFKISCLLTLNENQHFHYFQQRIVVEAVHEIHQLSNLVCSEHVVLELHAAELGDSLYKRVDVRLVHDYDILDQLQDVQVKLERNIKLEISNQNEISPSKAFEICSLTMLKI